MSLPELLNMEEIRMLDVIDLVLALILIYQLYRLVKGTSTINIFVGIVSIYLLYRLVKALKMHLLGEILGAFTGVGVIAIIVVFQPEIRKFLLMLGTPAYRKKRRFGFFKRFQFSTEPSLDIDPIITACQRMSASRTGALIVIERHNELGQFKESGIPLDARITEALICSIFFHNAPMHDGAVIIGHNRVQAGGCILPVSGNRNLPEHLGLRHRAAVGITEQSDAMAIIISEETGTLSFAEYGHITEGILPSRLKDILEEVYNPVDSDQPGKP
ncbi:MAG: diadenylate cyclase CdaA [Lentimicrobiaceae bacterium]|nr:diadenylate cyclase CdaA [Lentimicrobiaceae bacterium]